MILTAPGTWLVSERPASFTLPGRWEKEHMKNTIFLDMEACDADYGEHCGEKPTLGIAIGGYFFYTDGRMQWCDEDSLEDTVRELVNDEPLIVSFHGESFDYPLLRGVLRARGDRFKPLAFWRSDPIGKLERDLNALDATAAKLSQEDIFKARDLFEAVKSFDGFVDIRGDVNDLISHARAGVRRV
jgi:hypothetical protein